MADFYSRNTQHYKPIKHKLESKCHKQNNPNASTTNVIPFRSKHELIREQFSLHELQIELSCITHILPEFIDSLLTHIRPEFPEFTLHFIQNIHGLTINIIPNSLSDSSKQRLALLNQTIKQSLKLTKTSMLLQQHL